MSTRLNRISSALAAFVVVAGMAQPALAHRDPATCSGAGVGIQIFPFRTSGTCSDLVTPCSFDTTDPDNPVAVGCAGADTCNPLPLVGVVSECETILYNAKLFYTGNNTCAFSQGAWTLTLPDTTVKTLSNPVPCLGGGVAPCTGETSITSKYFAYKVQMTDNTLVTLTGYSGGVIHNGGATGTGDQLANTATTGDTETVVHCDDQNACTTDVCDPAKQGIDACSNTPIVCNDENACTSDTCDPATGCVYTTNPPCNDQNACTTDTCNPATGCVFTPIPDRKSTRLNSSHIQKSRMPSSA